MRLLLLLLLLLPVGCGRAHPSSAGLPVEQLEAAWTQQLALLDAAADPASGWPSATDCDAAIWAGEARLAGVASVQMQEALQPDGRPTRLPGADCLQASHTTSTDMQLGTILGLLAAIDRTSLEALQSYSEQHQGVVGTPLAALTDLAFVEMKPGTRSLLALATHHVGGAGADPWLELPIVYSPPFADYTLHLALLSLLGERLVGSEGPVDRELEAILCAANPSDALAQATCGNLGTAADLILSPSYTDPSYVRGAPGYSPASRLLVIHLILNGGMP